MPRLDHVILVGAGGTASHLVEPLARLVLHHPASRVHQREPGFTVVDGDTFEDGNATRQLGCAPGTPKAEVAIQRACQAGLSVASTLALQEYVDALTFADLLPDLPGMYGADPCVPLVVLAVDNHATRSDVLRALDASGLKTFLCISPGNDLAHGNVLTWARVDGKDVTDSPLASDPDGNPTHPELLKPQDRIPGGCIEQAPSTPQLIAANAWAACVTLAVVQAWLDDERVTGEVSFDCRKMRVTPGHLADLKVREAVRGA